MINEPFDLVEVVGPIAMGCLVVIAVFLLWAIAADKTVQRYYVGQPESERTVPGIVVMAERNWAADDPVYVTDDIEKAIRVTRRLNRVLDGNRPDEDDDRVRVSSSTSSAIVPYIVVPSR